IPKEQFPKAEKPPKPKTSQLNLTSSMDRYCSLLRTTVRVSSAIQPRTEWAFETLITGLALSERRSRLRSGRAAERVSNADCLLRDHGLKLVARINPEAEHLNFGSIL